MDVVRKVWMGLFIGLILKPPSFAGGKNRNMFVPSRGIVSPSKEMVAEFWGKSIVVESLEGLFGSSDDKLKTINRLLHNTPIPLLEVLPKTFKTKSYHVSHLNNPDNELLQGVIQSTIQRVTQNLDMGASYWKKKLQAENKVPFEKIEQYFAPETEYLDLEFHPVVMDSESATEVKAKVYYDNKDKVHRYFSGTNDNDFPLVVTDLLEIAAKTILLQALPDLFSEDEATVSKAKDLLFDFSYAREFVNQTYSSNQDMEEISGLVSDDTEAIFLDIMIKNYQKIAQNTDSVFLPMSHWREKLKKEIRSRMATIEEYLGIREYYGFNDSRIGLFPTGDRLNSTLIDKNATHENITLVKPEYKYYMKLRRCPIQYGQGFRLTVLDDELNKCREVSDRYAGKFVALLESMKPVMNQDNKRYFALGFRDDIALVVSALAGFGLVSSVLRTMIRVLEAAPMVEHRQFAGAAWKAWTLFRAHPYLARGSFMMETQSTGKFVLDEAFHMLWASPGAVYGYKQGEKWVRYQSNAIDEWLYQMGGICRYLSRMKYVSKDYTTLDHIGPRIKDLSEKNGVIYLNPQVRMDDFFDNLEAMLEDDRVYASVPNKVKYEYKCNQDGSYCEMKQHDQGPSGEYADLVKNKFLDLHAVPSNLFAD